MHTGKVAGTAIFITHNTRHIFRKWKPYCTNSNILPFCRYRYVAYVCGVTWLPKVPERTVDWCQPHEPHSGQHHKKYNATWRLKTTDFTHFRFVVFVSFFCTMDFDFFLSLAMNLQIVINILSWIIHWNIWTKGSRGSSIKYKNCLFYKNLPWKHRLSEQQYDST